jgi:hypothetical protein
MLGAGFGFWANPPQPVAESREDEHREKEKYGVIKIYKNARPCSERDRDKIR